MLFLTLLIDAILFQQRDWNDTDELALLHNVDSRDSGKHDARVKVGHWDVLMQRQWDWIDLRQCQHSSLSLDYGRRELR